MTTSITVKICCSEKKKKKEKKKEKKRHKISNTLKNGLPKF